MIEQYNNKLLYYFLSYMTRQPMFIVTAKSLNFKRAPPKLVLLTICLSMREDSENYDRQQAKDTCVRCGQLWVFIFHFSFFIFYLQNKYLKIKIIEKKYIIFLRNVQGKDRQFHMDRRVIPSYHKQKQDVQFSNGHLYILDNHPNIRDSDPVTKL